MPFNFTARRSPASIQVRCLAIVLSVLVLCLPLPSSADDHTPLEHPSDYLRVTDYPGGFVANDIETWRRDAPEVQEIEIASSADGAAQKALFYAPQTDQPRPLLVVLHSWSTDYRQNIDIPLARFAVANEWAFMHPDFRGQNDGRPESTASELAISDMQDALAYAREHANVDPSRIYLLGYSGGAMNALHLASRQPEVFAGISLWVPVYDLVSWYEWNNERGEKYAPEIAGACGGEPLEGSPAHAECVKRSPSSHVPALAGQLRVLIAHGLGDNTVPPDHALRLYNDLAKADERIAQEDIDALMASREVPEALAARSQEGVPARFDEAEADVALYLRSGPAELVLFDGEHDMLYRPGLDWLARQKR